MRKRIDNYTFDPSARTLTINGFTTATADLITTIDQDALISIVNTRTGTYLYIADAPVPSITISGKEVTFLADVTDQFSTDPLLIFYEDTKYPATASELTSTTTGLARNDEMQGLAMLLRLLLAHEQSPVWLNQSTNALNVAVTQTIALITAVTTVTGITNIGSNSAAELVPNLHQAAWATSIRSILT
jgi:hypothetical protein